MKIDLNVASIWTALVATGSAMLWLMTNIAWSADVDRIEARLIKRDLRELRHELEHEHDDEDRRKLEDEIEELLDDLCVLVPDDREC